VFERHAARVTSGGVEGMKLVALEKEPPGAREKALQPLLKEEARQVLPTLSLVMAGLN
jgi:hypothetical protein